MQQLALHILNPEKQVGVHTAPLFVRGGRLRAASVERAGADKISQSLSHCLIVRKNQRRLSRGFPVGPAAQGPPQNIFVQPLKKGAGPLPVQQSRAAAVALRIKPVVPSVHQPVAV